jgi:hypothetical protein
MESTSWSYSLLGILANRHIATISGNLDRAGAVALEHTIFTKGAWDPLGGIGLP